MAQSPYPAYPVLLVDDESHTLTSFDVALRSYGITNTIRCQDSREVAGILQKNEIELLLLDLMMPHVSGQEILSHVAENFPDTPVIVVTGLNEIETAVQCIQNGAFDYVLKPAEADRLLPSVRRALEVRRLRRENTKLSRHFLADSLSHPEAFASMITRDPKMQALFRYCEAVGEGSQPVLITGETGVGKEHIARALHEVSGRDGEFVPVNVAGLDDHMFSDTLFGHAKGAFTGADRARTGLVEKAAGGTLFLDEIGDLSEISQVKLLRFLEEHEFYPLGSDISKSSNARVLVATHKDIETIQNSGQFRKDLYYRLRTHHVRIPPLSDRKDDIPLLLDYFLEQAAEEFSKKKPTYHKELITLLKEHQFPGNIRELRAMVYDAVSSHNSHMLSSESFKISILNERKATTTATEMSEEGQNGWVMRLEQLPTLKDASQLLIEEALRRSNNNQRVAALMLGITPQALNQRLKRM